MNRKSLKRYNTDIEFSEYGQCLQCIHKSEHNVLIPLKTLKLRLFLYVQKAVESESSVDLDGSSLENKSICQFHLQQILDDRIDELLEEDLDQLYKLQEEGIKVLGQYEVEEDHWLQRFERQGTIGQNAADVVARVGGSWMFLLSLIGGIVCWMILNGAILTATSTPFDPFPFILLNLFLSCLAALQAPIIMMSQNRQDAKDREVNQFVSKVILRNEHQTRHVNAKIDHLLSFQWKRLLEIQEIQTVHLQIQRRDKKKMSRGKKDKTSEFFSVELIPDNFAQLLIRHALEIDSADDTLIFSHWHEEGDNFTGIIDNVLPTYSKMKLNSFDFDIFFHHHAVSLDDIISGDNRIVLRNDFHLNHMNLSGQITKIKFFINNQTVSYFARDLPQRYKPAYDLKRLDRISDFWKTQHCRIRMTYDCPRQYGVLHLSEGKSLKNASCTFFHSDLKKMDASLYALELPFAGESNEFESETSKMILKALTRPLSESISSWKKIAETHFEQSQAESSPNVVPLEAFSGPATILFVSQDVRVSIHAYIVEIDVGNSSNIMDGLIEETDQ